MSICIRDLICVPLHSVLQDRTINRGLEILAVVLNLLYTLFYLNGNPLCYLFGVIGPLSLIWLCYRNGLYAEPLLQLVYVFMAVYGYFHASETWIVTSWSGGTHVLLVFIGLVLSLTGGYLLSKFTEAKLPYPDSVVTVFAIIGTWLMVNYVHESWLYLMTINALSIIIYSLRKLYIGAAMYVLYFVMSVDGYFRFNWFEL
jgi:nicotinamide mononucleotide transporter